MSRVQPGINDIKTLYPELCKEMHPTKNGTLKPEEVSVKSHKMIWWICAKGHEWESMVSNRTGLGRGCPYCTGQKPIVGENDLATVNPELAKEWNNEKNHGLTPQDTYFNLVSSFVQDKDVIKGIVADFWKSLDEGQNYQDVSFCDNTIRFFGVSHTGQNGAINRIKGKNIEKGNRMDAATELMIKDWKRIGAYLKNERA